MAVDMFIKIDDIKGEAKDNDKDLDQTVQVLSWSWGMTQSGSAHSGGGSGAGKVNVQDLSFTKYVDAATPVLVKMTCNGQHFKNALLTVRKAGKNPIKYVTLKLMDGLISSVQTGGSGGEDRLTESVTLNFAKFEIVYTRQADTGLPGASIPAAWNIATNSDKLG